MAVLDKTASVNPCQLEEPLPLVLHLSDCQSIPLSLLTIFQNAWGVVLGAFVASDQVRFGIIDTQRVETKTACTLLLNKDGPASQIARETTICRDDGFDGLDTIVVWNTGSKTEPLIGPAISSSSELGEDWRRIVHGVNGVIPGSILVDITKTPFSGGDHVLRYMARTLRHILQQMLRRPHATLRELELVTEKEKALLRQWNPAIPPQPSASVHEVILENCEKRPERLAVSAWDGDITYRDLYSLTSRVASYLRGCKISRGAIVPVCFEKSKWAIVAMLGVLRAGAAYVFVDPASPSPRIRSICEDVKADVIICSAACMSKAKQAVPQVIEIESAMNNSLDMTRDLPSVEVADAVYAVFTSGSTGRPKGVVIEHGAFFKRAMANGQTLCLSHQSRVLQFANFVFDVANRDILYTLLFGGCVCIPSESDRSNNLAAFSNQKQVNWLSITPSMARLFDPAALPTLRHMVLCGESLTSTLVNEWANKLHLINAYGPSEATTISTLQTRITAKTNPRDIGQGSGSVVWLVDPTDHNRLAPIGAVGELVIESPSVGRGYLNRPTETQESFLPTTAWLSEFRTGPPVKQLYKTGDLAVYGKDGTILFMGRKDAQVKIRGQRVDLGEIEHWIQRSLPQELKLTTVVDLVTPRGRETSLLATFAAPREPQGCSLRDVQMNIRKVSPKLEEVLSHNLPGYMIPQVYLPLDAMPITATGKVHRQRLRQLGGSFTLEELMDAAGGDGSAETLDSPVGQTLSRLWASALGLQEYSIRPQDNFFRLGGDSIIAIRVATQSRAEGLDLYVADILELKELGSVADVIAARPRLSEAAMSTEPFSLCPSASPEEVADVIGRKSSDIADILPTTTEQVYYLTQWTLSCYCCMLQGPIDVDRLQAACRAVVSRHSALRTVFTELKSGNIVQVVLEDMDPLFSHHRTENLEAICSATVDSTIVETKSTAGQPLVRFMLISKSEKEHALLVRVSHAQYDGKSSSMIFRDLSAAYSSPQAGGMAPATPFSHYLHARSRCPSDEAFRFWRQNLQGASMTVLAPASMNANGKPEPETHIIAPAIGALPTPLRDLTMPTLLNAVCSLVLADMVKQEDVVIGIVMDTRTLAFPGIETMLGPCANTNLLRARLQQRQKMTFRSLCHSLHDQYAQMTRHAYCDLPDIVANCTNWPADTQQGCIINHLRMDDDAKGPALSLDGVSCLSFKKTDYITLSRQVLFRCITRKDRLEINVVTSSTMMDFSTAKGLADRIVSAVQKLSEAPDTPLAMLSPF